MTSPDKHSDTTHGTPPQALAVWLFLVGATVLAWFTGEGAAAGPLVVAFLFALAFVKGALIVLEYMALRRAPLLWRGITLGWLTLVCALIGLAYWKGIAP